jgi:hypothetical protein
MAKTLEITLKLTLEVDDVRDVTSISEAVQEATQGEFARKMWNIGDYVDMYVQKIEQRETLLFVDYED